MIRIWNETMCSIWVSFPFEMKLCVVSERAAVTVMVATHSYLTRETHYTHDVASLNRFISVADWNIEISKMECLCFYLSLISWVIGTQICIFRYMFIDNCVEMNYVYKRKPQCTVEECIDLIVEPSGGHFEVPVEPYNEVYPNIFVGDWWVPL